MCYYAIQDKVSVTDPNGHSWEFFFVKDEGGIGNNKSKECCPADGCDQAVKDTNLVGFVQEEFNPKLADDSLSYFPLANVFTPTL